MSKGGKRRKGWGDSYKRSPFVQSTSSQADPRIWRSIRIDENGERATEKQVAYLATLRPEIPSEVLPRLSKRQASKLIERAVQDTTKPRVAV